MLQIYLKLKIRIILQKNTFKYIFSTLVLCPKSLGLARDDGELAPGDDNVDTFDDAGVEGFNNINVLAA